MRSKLLIVAGLATSMLLATAATASARHGHDVVVTQSRTDFDSYRDQRHHQRRFERNQQRRMMRKALRSKTQTIAWADSKCARMANRLHWGLAKRKCRRTISRAMSNHNATWGAWAPVSRWDFAGLRGHHMHHAPAPDRQVYVAPTPQRRWVQPSQVVVRTY